MKATLKTILKMFVMVISSIILGGILLTLVYTLPIDTMKENVKISLSVYKWNPIEAWNKDYRLYTETDMQTEAIKIMEAISDTDGSAFSRAMRSVYYNYEDTPAMNTLVRYIKEGDEPIEIEYSRYWHGYLIYLKPLLSIVSLSTIKLLNMTLQLVLYSLMIILLYDRIGFMYAAAFTGAVLVLNPVTILLSMQNDIIIYIASIASIILLLFNDKMKSRKSRYCYLFLYIGISVAFLDFLTYPAVSIGIPLIIYILLNKENIRDYLLDMAALSASWLLGYAGMWIGKWVLSDLFLDTSVIQNGFANLLYRSGGDPYGETAEMDSSFWHVVSKNASVLNILPLKIFLVIMMLVTLLLFLRSRRRIDIAKLAAVFLVSLYPFGWYFVIRNHSVIHPWIEFRELAIFAFGIFCCMGILAGNSTGTGNQS